jgi:DNA polymerase (family X)
MSSMSEPLTNHQIAEVFRAITESMEILGEDRFRTQAYRRASEALTDLPQPLAYYRERGELADIPGVGKAIAEKIGELLDTGHLQFYEKLRARIPAGVLEMLRVPNLGPRTVARLYEEMGITSLDALEEAAKTGKLDKVKGLGARSIKQILEGIPIARQAGSIRRMLLAEAIRTAESLIEALSAAVPAISRIAPAGSTRRGRQTIGDLDILAAGADPVAIIQAFTSLPMVAKVESAGSEKASVLLHNGLQADLIAISPERWGSALQHFTGSQAHNIRLRERALSAGISVSEHGLKHTDGQLIPCAEEADVYRLLGLPYIPPELREDQGEFEAALAGTLPTLVELADMRSDLHMHSTWSDGRGSIAAMAEAARACGYSHIALTDHSAYLGITNGLDGARLREQASEINALNQQYAAAGDPFRILRGVEVDITPDGSLALPDEVLAELDLVVASPHVQLNQPPDQATERMLRAIRNPHVDIIGHPTGRLIDKRPGAPIDIDRVAQAAAEHRVLLEINSGPDRLDLEASAVRRALALGATLTINSDAHRPENLPWIRLGVLTARRGWASADRIANTWSLAQLQAWLKGR